VPEKSRTKQAVTSRQKARSCFSLLCVYTNSHIHIHINTHMHTHITHTHTHSHTFAYTHTRERWCFSKDVCISSHPPSRTSTRPSIYPSTHTHSLALTNTPSNPPPNSPVSPCNPPLPAQLTPPSTTYTHRTGDRCIGLGASSQLSRSTF